MPFLVAEKTNVEPKDLALETFRGDIFNQTDADLVLVYSNVCGGHWDVPPTYRIPPGNGASFKSSGDFANPACGTVSYQYQGAKVPGKPVFTISYSVPSVGKNHITVAADPGLRVGVEGDKTGWNVELGFPVTVG